MNLSVLPKNLSEKSPLMAESSQSELKNQLADSKTSSESSLPTVLQVEDDLIAIDLSRRALKATCTLEHAHNGLQALAMVQARQYQAIIMDINLGREQADGVEVTKRIRQLPQYQQVPIIAVTAYAMAGDKEEFLAAGCSHYLSKPFKLASLIRVVQAALVGADADDNA